MTTHYKTRAFVFKKKDVNESDRIFSVFTDDFGRLDIFAKAIRKSVSKLRSGIDIFFMSEVEFIQGKNRKTLTDASAIEKFDNILNSLERFKVANGIGKILDNFINGEEKDKDLFNLLDYTFCKLNDSKLEIRQCVWVYYYFLWNALSSLGYRPEVQKCGTCQGKLDSKNICFSYKLGGLVCQECLSHDSKAEKINSDVVKILRLTLGKEWAILSRLKIEPASQRLFKKISDSYYSYILSSHSFKNILRVDAKVV